MPSLRVRAQSVRWLLAELVVIVLGITIAFQVEEWRSRMEERRLEREALASILSELQIARDGFNIYLNTVSRLGNGASALRDYLTGAEVRERETLEQLVGNLGGSYRWQATDATFQSINPAILSDESLRADLILFNDGFYPFMLSISLEWRNALDAFRDVLYVDFERVTEFGDYDSTVVNLLAPVDRVPTNPKFLQNLDTFVLAGTILTAFIPEAITTIDDLSASIRAFMDASQ